MLKKSLFRIPVPILGILFIFVAYFITCLNECWFLYSQKNEAFAREQQISSFRYSIYSILAKIFDKTMRSSFYIGVFYFSEAIKSLTNSDYEFCALFVLARWVMFMPGSLIEKFVVDSNFGFNKTLFSEFMQRQFIEQIIILGSLYLMVFIFNFAAEKHSTRRNNLPNNFELSSSSDEESRLAPISMRAGSPFPELFIILFVISFSIFFFVSLFYDFFFNRMNVLIDPDGKLKAALSFLETEHEMRFDGMKVKLQGKKDLHLFTGFDGLLKRKIVVSDTAEQALSVEHLTAILVDLFYRANSQEGVLILITHFIEVPLYLFVVSRFIKENASEDMKLKDFISYILPVGLTFFYCLDSVSGLFRRAIHKKFVYNADVFAVDFGVPIADALVQFALNNKNAVMNTFLYSTFVLEEPSLQDRLNFINSEKMR